MRKKKKQAGGSDHRGCVETARLWGGTGDFCLKCVGKKEARQARKKKKKSVPKGGGGTSKLISPSKDPNPGCRGDPDQMPMGIP